LPPPPPQPGESGREPGALNLFPSIPPPPGWNDGAVPVPLPGSPGLVLVLGLGLS